MVKNMNPPSTDPLNEQATPHTVLNVIQESLNVYKSTVDNGGVRVTKLVHAEVVDVDEPLETQSVKLTRVPINREVDGPVSIRYENGATIIPVVEERIITRRQLVLVEEIHVSRETHIKRVPQSVTLRREKVVIERQKPGETTWHPDDGSAPVT
jgi:uncharacterized protein (TIGR02271 family)